MYCSLKTCSLEGLEGNLIDVEADLSNGLPKFIIVGLPDTAIKESIERVRSGIKNSGFEFPLKRITINLAPANLKKDGSQLDLAIAMAILGASEEVQDIDEDYIFLGELSLDGGINPITGALAMIISLREQGFRKFIVPEKNKIECSLIRDVEIYPADSLRGVVEHVNKEKPIERYIGQIEYKDDSYDLDFSDIKGQAFLKRSLEVSAAGKHNILLIGVPGSGKSMAAKRYATILPKLSFEESIEVTKIYSVAGLLKENNLMINPPFRSPHHTASSVSLIGGGRIPKPGEISLSHNGVLFLDELLEFPKSVLEVLRQPLEDKTINIARANASISYPANFILLAATNPCPCGYYGDPHHECTCSVSQIERYMSRASQPLLDRIDIHVKIDAVDYKHLAADEKSESSKDIAKRVAEAREIQKDRYKNLNINYNSDLRENQVNIYCRLDKECKKIMELAFNKYRFSARAYNKILKVSRTIADLSGNKEIEKENILEAIRYRSLDLKRLV
ncbi:YifB family Mg chelatase-like AAA ATPase [Peptoniphilus catoniae]|uniref:YifB family Mg chelatase-like AAA ATPase n=1 Tax=Peptoniphilus catoniae TaxID=1660341 RepID=UPI0010FD1B8E|nr:YifB family Mg chelatase-like AAA ATPase [Peptoniphilus catoniae]